MATVNTFVGCCCSLVSRTGETEIAGTLVDLAELQLPISDKEQLHEQLPGLSLRVDNVTTTYALITSHSVLPGSTFLKEWNFSEKFLGRQAAEKTLNEFVVGVVSCCGPNSIVIEGGTVVRAHPNTEDCDLGLNFTMLFLNEHFQQHYCTHFGTQIKPPVKTFSQCEADINWIDQYLSQANNYTPEEVLTARPHIVQFNVINTSCNEVPLNAVEAVKEQKERQLPDLQLCQEIVRFSKVKSVRCEISESSPHPSVGAGMPLVCRNSGEDFLRLIGVLTGHGKALILSSLLQLLKGSPAPCLSLLLNTQMRRLWIYKWSHLIIPHLKNLQDQPEQVLQILIVLFQKKNNLENFLSVSPQDDSETRLGFLKLVQALFHQYRVHDKSTITTTTKMICNQANMTEETFLGKIHGLCESLLSISGDCGEYKKKHDVQPLIEHCVSCGFAMLNYQHENEVVEKMLFADDNEFEQRLPYVRRRCAGDSDPEINFYKKRHAYCKCIQERQKNEIEILKEEVESLKVQRWKLQCAEPAATPTEAREEESNNGTQSPVTAVFNVPQPGRFRPPDECDNDRNDDD